MKSTMVGALCDEGHPLRHTVTQRQRGICVGKRNQEAIMRGAFCGLKVYAAILAAMFMVTSAPSQSYAASGTVHLKVTKVGFIVGVGGGSGTLTFHGKTYRLSVGGVSAGTIGVAGTELVGTATNLRTAEDIVGSYSAASAGVAVAGGAKAVTLQNGKGVVLSLHGRQVGFEASLSLSGLTISMQ